jgi:hypothetical protein
MAMVVIVPLWVVFTAIGFDEPLVAACAMSALYFQLRLIDAPSFRDAVLLGLVLGGGLLTKQSGEFAVILLPTSLLLFAWRAPRLGSRLLRWVGATLLAFLIGYVLYSVERLSPLFYQRAQIAKSLGQYTPIGDALHEIGAIFQRNWPGYRAEIDGYISAPLMIAFAIGIGLLLARRIQVALLMLVWIVIPLGGVVLIANRPLGHYLIPVLTPAVVVIAIGVVETSRWLRAILPRGRRRAAGLGLAGLVAFCPALLFDIRFIVDPARTQLPSYDDRELVTDAAAGSGWSAFVSIIERRATQEPMPHVIAYGGLITYDVSLLLGDPGGRRYPYVSLDSPAATSAQFVVATDGLPPRCPAPPHASNTVVPTCSEVARSRLRELAAYQRPRGGSRIVLYQVGPPPPASPARR